jgi:hypothetical protein
VSYYTVFNVRARVMDIAALLRVLTQAPYSLRFRRASPSPRSATWRLSSSCTSSGSRLRC